MCGCQGQSWRAPATQAEVRAARAGRTTAERPKQTRELIPGGYWNGPKAKKK
jgi:hypothetical protein